MAQQETSINSADVLCQLPGFFLHFTALIKKVLYPAEWQIRWEPTCRLSWTFKMQFSFEQRRIRKDSHPHPPPPPQRFQSLKFIINFFLPLPLPSKLQQIAQRTAGDSMLKFMKLIIHMH